MDHPGPNPHLGLHLKSQEFAVVMKYRLGIPIYPEGTLCQACSTLAHPVIMDRMSDHSMNCHSGRGMISRHNKLRDVIAATAAAASLSPRVEAKGLVAGANYRPGDVYLAGWPQGRNTALDITVVNPLQDLYIQQAAATPGAALEGACKRKWAQAGDYCRREGLAFQPIALESLGGFHSGAVEVVRRLTSILARNNGQDEKEAARHCFQRMSLVLQQGNAEMIIHRLPPIPSAEIDGVE